MAFITINGVPLVRSKAGAYSSVSKYKALVDKRNQALDTINAMRKLAGRQVKAERDRVYAAEILAGKSDGQAFIAAHKAASQVAANYNRGIKAHEAHASRLFEWLKRDERMLASAEFIHAALNGKASSHHMPTQRPARSRCAVRAVRTRTSCKAAIKAASGDSGDPDPEPRRRTSHFRSRLSCIPAAWQLQRPDNPRATQSTTATTDRAFAPDSVSPIAVWSAAA